MPQIEVPPTVDPIFAALVMEQLKQAIESGRMVDLRIFVGRVSRQTGYPVPPRLEVREEFHT